MFLLLDKYRDRVITASWWTLLLLGLVLLIGLSAGSAAIDNFWLYAGRPIFGICVFLLISLNLRKIAH